ncbi:MAG TPA: FixH family protein [Polyangiales bacterium]|nr:FixH family protein [Polyangiales bacterium]
MALACAGGFTAACGDDAAMPEQQVGGDAAVYAACPDSLPEFAVGLARVGEDERLQARLLDASQFPPHKYANEWTLELANADGDPLVDAEITRLAAFMPIHGHYGRPAAKYEALAEPGQVRAEIHFTMRGPWEVQIWASSAEAGDDYLTFEVCVVE